MGCSIADLPRCCQGLPGAGIAPPCPASCGRGLGGGGTLLRANTGGGSRGPPHTSPSLAHHAWWAPDGPWPVRRGERVTPQEAVSHHAAETGGAVPQRGARSVRPLAGACCASG